MLPFLAVMVTLQLPPPTQIAEIEKPEDRPEIIILYDEKKVEDQVDDRLLEQWLYDCCPGVIILFEEKKAGD